MQIRHWTRLLVGAALVALVTGPALSVNDEEEVTVANLNLLHGFACDPAAPDDGDQCRVRDRIDLLMQHIERADCPDVVTLQENVTEEFVQPAAGVFVGPLDDTVELIEDRLKDLAKECGFKYELVFDPEGATVPPPPPAINGGRGVDEEVILSRYPVSDAAVEVLYSPIFPFFSRHVLFARVEHPSGPIDVFTTHLASGSDAASAPCGVPALPGPPFTPPSPPCPAECVAGPGPPGTFDTVRECQAKQMVNFIEDRHDVANPALATGDFNARFGTGTYNIFADRGWIDSHLAAGNGECDPDTGEDCTSGGGLEDPDLKRRSRIDYIFVVPAEPGAECAGGIVPSEPDDDFDEVTTGLFAAVPNPFEDDCGFEPPDAICWPSNHSGNIATLDCEDGE